ncbi:MAG TPA: hypothetical protein VLJ21_02375 [Candidatus Binatia bacterium]|nr:hypothetical protein [Candidatus Binatia bacterium]
MNEEFEERKRVRRIRIISWGIIVIMVLSAAGYYIGSSSSGNVQRYHGTAFTSTQQGVLATIQGTHYAFNYFPSQVEGIDTDPGVPALLQAPILLVTYDTQSNYSESMAAVQYYLADLFERQFDTYLVPAVMNNASYHLPLVTCANATVNEPVIEFTEDNTTAILLEGSCIHITVPSQDDLFRVQDKLVFLRLGVMDR